MRPAEINLAVCGHAKHGKSTLAGRLMLTFGAVTEEDLRRIQQQAEKSIPEYHKYRRDFNKYNIIFLLKRTDTFQRGSGQSDDPSRTVIPTLGSVELDNRRLTIIDTPGFSRYLDNIIYGIHLADYAILVVEAASGVADGTLTIAYILKALNVPLMAVCITKMDEVGYVELRYKEIVERIKELLKDMNISSDLPIVPVSALTGAGISGKESSLSWYSGLTLVQAIDNAEEKIAPSHLEEVRFAVRGEEVFSPPGVGTVLVGSLETGQLAVGDELVFEPASTQRDKVISTRVRSIHIARSLTEQAGKNVDRVTARSIIAVGVPDVTVPQAEQYLKRGGVLGKAQSRPAVANLIEAEILLFRADKIYVGKEYVMFIGASRVTAKIASINQSIKLSHLDENARIVAERGQKIVASLRLNSSICIETEERFLRLTRFVLREKEMVVACGRCIRVLE